MGPNQTVTLVPTQAVTDKQWWDEASRHLPPTVDPTGYRSALWERFRNPRIAHSLVQISADGLTKISIRIAPVARLELRAGRDASAAAAVIAAWIAAVRSPLPIADSRSADIDQALGSADPTVALLALAADDLAGSAAFARQVAHLTDGLLRAS